MNIFGIEIRRAVEPSKHFFTFGYGQSAAGVPVNEDSALGYGAVFACVQVLSRAVASLPLHLYKRVSDRERVKATEHPLYRIMHDSPNPWYTSCKFREANTACALLHGSGPAEIVRNGKGQVEQIWWMNPNYVKVRVVNKDSFVYDVNIPGTETVTLRQDQVFMLKGFGTDPLNPKSPLRLFADVMGTGIAADKFGASFFANGAKLGGTLTTPSKLSPEAKDRLKEQFEKFHGGLSNAHRVALLEEGMEYKDIGMPPGDAQLIETKRFTVEDIARIFNVPLFLIQSAQTGTAWGSGIEQLNIAFVTHQLRPWLVNIEQELNKSLLLPTEQGNYYFEFDVNGLMRGDAKSRNESYSIGHNNGWYSANDVRAFENLNPIEGGDVYLLPLNMAPADQVVNGTAQAKQGANNEPVQKAPTPVKRSIDDAVPTLKPVLTDAISRLIRRARADLGRKLTADTAGAVDTIIQYINSDWSQFATQTVQPVYAGLAASIGTDNALVWSAEMVGRLATEIIDTATIALETSQNASASVDGVLVAIGNRSMDIADAELSHVVASVSNTEDDDYD